MKSRLTFQDIKGVWDKMKQIHPMHPIPIGWELFENGMLYRDQVVVMEKDFKVVVGSLPYFLFNTWGVNHESVSMAIDHAYERVRKKIEEKVGFINSQINYKYKLT